MRARPPPDDDYRDAVINDHGKRETLRREKANDSYG
jgi:hypothetical protein